MKFKVCGLTRLEDALLAVEYGATAIGVIIGAKSKRKISLGQARNILEYVPSSCLKVGVVADAPLTEVQELARVLRLDLVQLHGRESPAYCQALGWPAVKAWPVVQADQQLLLQELQPYLSLVEAILLDNRCGGSGTSFDWTLLKGLELPRPVWIAGGLKEENIPQLLDIYRPWLLDINSGVETRPGLKDPEKIARIAALLRRC